MHISDDMVLSDSPPKPCTIVERTLLENLEIDGSMQITASLGGQMVESTEIDGHWRRCPPKDNT